MTKRKFLAKLKYNLHGLSRADRQRSLDYYAEMLDDRMEEGMSEDEAVAAIGTPDEAASQIFAELQPDAAGKSSASRSMRGWEIVLLILGSPLWLTLLIALFAVLLAVLAVGLALYVSVWAVIFSLWASWLAVGLTAVVGIPAAVVMLLTGKPGVGLFLLGSGLILASLTVGLFFLFTLLTKLLWKLSTHLVRITVVRTKKGEVSV